MAQLTPRSRLWAGWASVVNLWAAQPSMGCPYGPAQQDVQAVHQELACYQGVLEASINCADQYREPVQADDVQHQGESQPPAVSAGAG